MKIFVLKEDQDIESRVSLTPDISKKLLELGHEITFEAGAGSRAGFDDFSYESTGVEVSPKPDLSIADVIFAINPLSESRIKTLQQGAIVIALQDPFNATNNLKLLATQGITSFALELLPRTTRAQYMDVLSSQASLAGYEAVIESAHMLDRSFPLMMTSAGTIPAAKVLVIGAGVAGLQAIATAKRLGAVVSAFDVRSSAKEQVESLGAKFIEVDSAESFDGVYATEMTDAYRKAQEEKLRSVLPYQDVVITTAQIPGKKAPIILKNDMIETMKHNALIIDLASKTGGNCELTESGRIIDIDGVKIMGFDNILNLISYDASRLFSKNVFSFFEHLLAQISEKGSLDQVDDEIIKTTLLTHKGHVVHKLFGGV